MNDSVVEKACENFLSGCNCAQSIVKAFYPNYGLDVELAMRMSSSFGGGMGHTGNICGTVTGAVMVIGLHYGKADVMKPEEKLLIDDKVKKFFEEFKRRNGSLLCRELIGYDISKPEEREICMSKQITKKKCPNFVKNSAEILKNLLEN